MSSTDIPIAESMRDCSLCPRECHADRQSGVVGVCGQTAVIRAARAALHFWEEPCISGSNGSGTVFFSGCGLGCVFCQNHDISAKNSGHDISPQELTRIFLDLQRQGAHNINLVTPSHFIPQIVLSLRAARLQGLSVPVVYNTGGYEKVSSLRTLEGLIDIYLPDLKYFSPELSARYAHAADYFEKASAAIAEMYRQVGTPVLEDSSDGNPIMKKGMIVRHLLLPGQTKDSKKILRYLYETYKNDIYVSIMNQYTPLPHTADIPELNRPVTEEEYAKIVLFAQRLGITNGFIQESSSADKCFIPEFDGTGLL